MILEQYNILKFGFSRNLDNFELIKWLCSNRELRRVFKPKTRNDKIVTNRQTHDQVAAERLRKYTFSVLILRQTQLYCVRIFHHVTTYKQSFVWPNLVFVLGVWSKFFLIVSGTTNSADSLKFEKDRIVPRQLNK